MTSVAPARGAARARRAIGGASIRALSLRFNTTARTLRFYEEKGVVSPHRRGQIRTYDVEHVRRLTLAMAWRRLGAALNDIGVFLEADAVTAEHALLCAMEAFRQREAAKLRRLDLAIEGLRAEGLDDGRFLSFLRGDADESA